MASYDTYGVYDVYTRALNKRQREGLIDGLADALPELRIKALFRQKRMFFNEAETLTVAVEHNTNALIAISVSRWIDGISCGPLLQIVMQLIAQPYRRTTLLKRIWGVHLKTVSEGVRGAPSVIALRTCSASVLHILRMFSRIDGVRVYPDIDSDGQDPKMLTLARSVARRLAPGLEFDAHSAVITNAAVPDDFYATLPRSNDERIDGYMRRHLTRADRLLCLLTMFSARAKQDVFKRFGLSPATASGR